MDNVIGYRGTFYLGNSWTKSVGTSIKSYIQTDIDRFHMVYFVENGVDEHGVPLYIRKP